MKVLMIDNKYVNPLGIDCGILQCPQSWIIVQNKKATLITGFLMTNTKTNLHEKQNTICYQAESPVKGKYL